MRIGITLDVGKPLDTLIDDVGELAAAGLDSVWVSQIFGPDALTLLAVLGRAVPTIGLGTAVVPVYPRHPQMLAAQALTVQQATGGRLTLGIGLSHQIVVEGLWGYDYSRPARYMGEYLSALLPMLHGEAVSVEGEVLKCVSIAPLDIPGSTPPPVLVAALGPAMLRLAGAHADGTVTWMTGISTIASHIAPTLHQAATEAGRPSPRVAVALPICMTADHERASGRIDEVFSIYPNLPSYRAMLDREGASSASDIALVGSEEQILNELGRLAAAGGTDLLASVVGDPDERAATFELRSRVATQPEAISG